MPPHPDLSQLHIRLFYEFERPRNGRLLHIPLPPTPLTTSHLLTFLSATLDLTRYTPHIYDPTPDCFIPLPSHPPTHPIHLEPSPPPHTTPRLDVKLITNLTNRTTTAFAHTLLCDSSDTTLTARWFGIGILRGKTASNHGTLWRSALQFGAALTFTIGKRYEKKVEGSADVFKTYRQVPCIAYEDVASFMEARPIDAQVVVVEYGGEDVCEFVHPKRALYVLGSEDDGVPPALVRAANRHVSIATVEGRPSSLNVAAAGAIVMYDRLTKERRGKAVNEEVGDEEEVDGT